MIREWLDTLYARSPGYFNVIPFDHGKPVARGNKWYSTSDTPRAARTIEAYKDKYDIYVSVATHNEPAAHGRGTRKTVASIPGFWADLDIGVDGHKAADKPNPADETEALSILDGMPTPTAVVHSGGGLQVWWMFDQPWTFDNPAEAARASEDWQRLLVERADAKGLHVDAVGDLTRILRVPGTTNRKLTLPRPVRLIEWTDTPTYPAPMLASLGVRALPHEPAPVDEGPLGTWAQILTPHGWTYAGEDVSGAGLWARPGKSPSDGHSATTDPYGVPVMVNFSASTGLPTGEGQRLTKFRVWAFLNYGGDETAAKAALGRLTKDSPRKLDMKASRFNPNQTGWVPLWTEEDDVVNWLVEPLLERGRQIALYSEAKAGKSLLMLEICAALASGRAVLGMPAGPPIRVVYCDMENTRKDLRERLTKMGYFGSTFNDNFFYYSFPPLSPLDTEEGGLELYSLAYVHDADLTVIDTLSRVVEGDENENDTYHDFYKFTGIRFKAAGKALVRLDHSGKDVHKGMRGASSKTTDVDDVWQMTVMADIVTLVRTHSRAHHGTDRLVLSRLDDPLRHELSSDFVTGPTTDEQIQVWMDLQQIDPMMPLNQMWTTHRKAAQASGFTQAKLEAAQKVRRIALLG